MLGEVADLPAALRLVREPATPQELMAASGAAELDVGEVADDPPMRFNDPAVVGVGVPCGGGVMRASDLALRHRAVARRAATVVGRGPGPNPGDADQRWKELLSFGALAAGFARRGFVALSIEVTDAGAAEFVAVVVR